MKRFVRVLAVVLSVVTLVCACPVPLSATAAPVLNYTVETIEVNGMIKQGETVTVRIGVMPIKAVCMMQVKFRYDDTLFEVAEGSVSPYVASNFSINSLNVAPIDNQTGVPLTGTVVFNAINMGDVAIKNKTFVASVVLRARKDVHVTTELKAEELLAATFPASPIDCYVIQGQIVVNKGDVNGDGKMTVADAYRVFQDYNGTRSLNESQRVMADLDGDGVITLSDVTRLFYRVS